MTLDPKQKLWIRSNTFRSRVKTLDPEPGKNFGSRIITLDPARILDPE